jgi:hypothetical protein
VHPLPYHETQPVPAYHDLHYTVPQPHGYSKFDRLGETVDRLGIAFNTTAVRTPEDWLAKYLVPGVEAAFDGEPARGNIGETMEPSSMAQATEGEIAKALKEKRTYVEMLEKLLQFRLEQGQGTVTLDEQM